MGVGQHNSIKKPCTNLAQLIPTNPLNTGWLTFRVCSKNHFTKIFGTFWARFISYFLSEASDTQITIFLSTDVQPLLNKCGVTVYHVTVSCHCSTMLNIVKWEISRSEMPTSGDLKTGYSLFCTFANSSWYSGRVGKYGLVGSFHSTSCKLLTTRINVLKIYPELFSSQRSTSCNTTVLFCKQWNVKQIWVVPQP